MPALPSLWDGNEYTDYFERMVAIIKEAALARQGQDTSDDRLGQELLDCWGIDENKNRSNFGTSNTVPPTKATLTGLNMTPAKLVVFSQPILN